MNIEEIVKEPLEVAMGGAALTNSHFIAETSLTLRAMKKNNITSGTFKCLTADQETKIRSIMDEIGMSAEGFHFLVMENWS